MSVEYRVLGPARGVGGRAAGAARRAEAAGGARPPAVPGEHRRARVATRRRALGRRPAGLGGESRPGLRLRPAQGAGQGGDRDARRRLRRPRRARALSTCRFERLAHEGSGALEDGTIRPPPQRRSARRSASGAGRRSPISRTSPRSVGDLRTPRGAPRPGARAAGRSGHRLGRHADVVGELETLVAEHPLRERPRGLLMTALYRSGRQAEALEAYRDARAMLVDELGIEPSAWLTSCTPRSCDRMRDALRGRCREVEDAPALGPRRRSRRGAIAPLAALAAPARSAAGARAARADDGRDGATSWRRRRALDDLRASLVAEGSRRAPPCSRRWPRRRHGPARARARRRPAAGGRTRRPARGRQGARAARPGTLRRRRRGRDSPGAGSVVVPFAGAEHDWAAVELGAWLARGRGSSLRLVGAATGPGRTGASRLLAHASIAVQRALGVPAEPVLVEPEPEALVAAADGAGVVVVGLTDRWRREGLGRARTALATRADADGARPSRRPPRRPRPAEQRDALHLDDRRLTATAPRRAASPSCRAASRVLAPEPTRGARRSSARRAARP